MAFDSNKATKVMARDAEAAGTAVRIVTHTLPIEPVAPIDSPEATLDQLAIGRRGEIVAVRVEGPVGERLRDLGFLPGTKVVLERRAPLGDPAVYALRGTRMCLRRSEACGIRIRLLG